MGRKRNQVGWNTASVNVCSVFFCSSNISHAHLFPLVWIIIVHPLLAIIVLVICCGVQIGVVVGIIVRCVVVVVCCLDV